MDPSVTYPLGEAIEAIKDADLSVMGPGSLYTSIVPNLLVNDIVGTINNTKAPKVYICNVMTQPGETDDFGVLDHVQGILNHSRQDLLDFVIANTEEIPDETLSKYITDGARPVILRPEDKIDLASKNIKLIADNLIEIKSNYIRHDNIAVSKILIDIARGKYEKDGMAI